MKMKVPMNMRGMRTEEEGRSIFEVMAYSEETIRVRICKIIEQYKYSTYK